MRIQSKPTSAHVLILFIVLLARRSDRTETTIQCREIHLGPDPILLVQHLRRQKPLSAAVLHPAQVPEKVL